MGERRSLLYADQGGWFDSMVGKLLRDVLIPMLEFRPCSPSSSLLMHAWEAQGMAQVL